MSSIAPTEEELKRLIQAAVDGDVETLSYLIEEKKFSIETRGPSFPCYGGTLLIISSSQGQLKAVKKLISLGADLRATDEDGDTALNNAAWYGHTEIVEYLLSAGADLNIAGNNGSTALHEAAYKGRTETVDHLLSAGADVSITNNDGDTALHRAAYWGRTETVDHLLSAGADVSITNNDGDKALHRAAYCGRTETVDHLLSAGADVSITNNNGNTALHDAAYCGHTETVDHLLSAGADVSFTNNDGDTALHRAAYWGHTETVDHLLSAGADVSITNNNGNTALHEAAYKGRTETVDHLLSAGADVSITNNDNQTPFQKAVDGNKSAVVSLFVNKYKVDLEQYGQDTQDKIRELLKEEAERQDSSEDETEEELRAYKHALKHGQAKSSSVSIYVLGQENVGKSCLVGSLLGDKFEENAATKGADVDICTVFSSQWNRVDKKNIPKKLHKMYQCRLKATAEIKISAKQQKSVMKAENKQQLLDSLPALPKAVKAELEQAKTAVLVDEDGINAIIWDFAGQSVYYGLHSMFLKEDNVAMIVFDASQNLQDPVKCRESDKSPDPQMSINPVTTGCESVCYWLKSIHSICRKDGALLGATSKFVPTVFLVATHLDLLGDSKAVEKRKQEIINQLILALQGKPFAKHLAGIEEGLENALMKNCFFISNKDRDQKVLDQLRSALVTASQYIANKEHPVVFLNIQKSLLSLGKTAITTAEFHRIANESGFFTVAQSAELRGALAHFHSQGTILHFPQTHSLKDVVVLSPDWLTKLFAYVIVAHPYKTESDYFAQHKRLKSLGILEEDFIAYMVSKFNKEQEKFGLPLTTEQAIEFAQQFGFIVEINSNTCFLEEKQQPPANEKKIFIVPPMLPLELPGDIKLPQDSDPQARIVYFKYSEGFIPAMVYYQVLGSCIDRNMKRNEDLYWIRRKIIKLVLGRDQLYYVSLCEDHNSIRLAITPDEDGIVKSRSLQERWKLIEDFTAKLKETTKAFMPASELPQCYVPCSQCSDLHLKLDDIRSTDKPLRCFKGKLPEDYYSDIRQYQDIKIPDEVAATGDFELPPQISKKVPTLPKLVLYLRGVKDWEEFGVFLLPEDEIDLLEEIKIDNEGKGLSSCKMALYRKYLKCGVKTWETVINALELSKNVNIMKEVKMHLIKDFM